jgi:hypothetical protein
VQTRVLPVLAKDGEPVGILTADDLAACIGRRSPRSQNA